MVCMSLACKRWGSLPHERMSGCGTVGELRGCLSDGVVRGYGHWTVSPLCVLMLSLCVLCLAGPCRPLAPFAMCYVLCRPVRWARCGEGVTVNYWRACSAILSANLPKFASQNATRLAAVRH